MSLQLYKKKRNFRATPEPPTKTVKSKSHLVFVVQRHKATHLHYDFRIEIDGVLKSWAVPKGPSLNPLDKRLAMMVEDHPFDYKNFEGIIPEGNYGAGIVEIWDEGEVSDLDNSEKKIAEKNLKAGILAGSLKFRLYGKKLKGEFALVKIKGRGDNSWLLIKHKDQYATTENYNSEEFTPKNSPINKWLLNNKKNALKTRRKSFKSSKEIFSDKKKEDKEVSNVEETHLEIKESKPLPINSRKLSHFIKPMLARETERAFSDKEWIYEMKWDGYRAIAEVNKEEVSLYSRNGNSFNASYPVVVEALKELNINAFLDGEIVIVDENGKSNFQLLQYYKTDKNHVMQFRAFDLLFHNGKNICDLPLLERKKILKKILKKNNVIKYSDHIEEKGIEFFDLAVKNDLEGIIAKKADSFYSPGVRTKEWLKIKNHKTQEAIIAGFTAPGGSRKHFGALILGVFDGNKLKYIGNTGSGFTEKSLNEISKLLKPLIQKNSPFEQNVKAGVDVTWVKPVLVCEIKYTEWTKDGSLRHPIFLRLRDDKKANEVTMKAVTPVKPEKNSKRKIPTKKIKLKKASSKKNEETNDKQEELISFGKIKVKVTNLKKVFWPKEGITKGDVINYYQSISKYILPYLKDRPQSLKRTPNGINQAFFYHKDVGLTAPDWVKSVPIFSESANKDINYIICNDKATLAYLNNLGCIELNPWHSTIQKLDNPDYLIIDIDPSKNNSFDQVIEAANVIYEIFKKAGITSYCKTSGATGMHVYVPAKKKYTYEQLKDFAHLICMIAQEQLPGFTSLERNLKKRGDDRIYLDHLQNRRGQTIASVYSLRPKENATVSMPLKWTEVKYGLLPQNFTIYNSLQRIEKTADIFSGIFGTGLNLDKALKLLDK